jgi:mRNA-degrading endonuclease toxin of MazEF toxin-antitoxin module
MGKRVNRGDIWLAQVGRKPRPVVILTRTEVIDVRSRITVAEITTNARGLTVEVAIDHDAVGLAQPSVINCDGLHTVAKTTLTTFVGTVDDDTLHNVCVAVGNALGC